MVTGGSGFLGSAFVRLSRQAGHQVAVLSRSGLGVPEGTIWLSGGISDPPWKEIERFAPTACLHAAWIATPGVYLESPENEVWMMWSFDFLSRLAESGVGRVTVLGTCIEYQIDGNPLCEDKNLIAPASPYARAKCSLHKKLVAHWARLAAEGSPVPALAWARIFYPYGEGEHPARLVSSLIAKLFRGESVSLKNPQSIKDYIHVEDVASGLLTIVNQKYTGAINVGTGQGLTVGNIAREIGQIIGRTELINIPQIPPEDPLDYVVANVARLRGLGWTPQITISAGLNRMVQAHNTGNDAMYVREKQKVLGSSLLSVGQ